MDAIEPMLRQAAPLLLVVTRVGGLFLFTPLLANRTVPRRMRAILALAMGVAVFAGAPRAVREGGAEPPTDLIALAPLVVAELLIGAVMGLIAALPIFALDLAGFIIGHQMGLGLARVYNPELDADSDVLSQLLMYAGLGVFVSLGGLEVMYVSLAGTFERVPAGAFGLAHPPLDAVVGVLAGGFDLALRVAAPVICIILLVMIAMGFLMKSMPQINVLSVGFTVKILSGLAVAAAALGAMQQAAGDEIHRVLGLVFDWGRGVGM